MTIMKVRVRGWIDPPKKDPMPPARVLDFPENAIGYFLFHEKPVPAVAGEWRPAPSGMTAVSPYPEPPQNRQQEFDIVFGACDLAARGMKRGKRYRILPSARVLPPVSTAPEPALVDEPYFGTHLKELGQTLKNLLRQ
jgi:hypothetical protein